MLPEKIVLPCEVVGIHGCVCTATRHRNPPPYIEIAIGNQALGTFEAKYLALERLNALVLQKYNALSVRGNRYERPVRIVNPGLTMLQSWALLWYMEGLK